MVSGGSSASRSLTCAATTVTEQASLKAKSTSGSSVKVVDPPLCVAACEPVVAQEMSYQARAAFTGSLNLTTTFELRETCWAPLAGVVELTFGARSAPDVTVCEPSPPNVFRGDPSHST